MGGYYSASKRKESRLSDLSEIGFLIEPRTLWRGIAGELLPVFGRCLSRPLLEQPAEIFDVLVTDPKADILHLHMRIRQHFLRLLETQPGQIIEYRFAGMQLKIFAEIGGIHIHLLGDFFDCDIAGQIVLNPLLGLLDRLLADALPGTGNFPDDSNGQLIDGLLQLLKIDGLPCLLQLFFDRNRMVEASYILHPCRMDKDDHALHRLLNYRRRA